MIKKLSEWNSIKLTVNMYKRIIIRSLVMILLLGMAAYCLDTFTEMSRRYGYDVAGRYPELLQIFRATAILAWFELSVFWIRLAVAPKSDEQAAAEDAIGNYEDPGYNQMASAVIYVTYTIKWAFRLWILLTLCDYIK